jgi:hypothetical protein
MILLLCFLILIIIIIGSSAAANNVIKQCAFEKSGYFVILNKMTYDEAAMACVQQGAVLAPFLDALAGIIETCAEWEMDSLEPWVARRMGDVECPYIPPDRKGVRLERCAGRTTRPAICWRYPIALVTVTKTRIKYSTLTDYVPSIVSTSYVLPPDTPSTTTFTWTDTVTRTITKQKRVPRYLLEHVPGGKSTVLTSIVHEHVTMQKQVPSATVTQEELAVAVHHATVWQTEFTATIIETVSINCN